MTYMSYCGNCGGSSGYSMPTSSTQRYSASFSSSSRYSSIDYAVTSLSGPGSYIAPEINNLEAVAYSAPQRWLQPHDINDYLNACVNRTAYAGQAGYELTRGSKGDYFSPAPFLNNNRPVSQFIGSVDDIKHYIKQAFELTTGKIFPEDIIISVVPIDEFKEKHAELGGRWSPGIQGFSINKKGFSQSLIILKEDDLDRMMITIGHEIGHVLSFQLPEKIDEEAKAFAFELEWIRVVHDNNIAGLKSSINLFPMPANNGLHDIAFDFVRRLVRLGRAPLDVFKELIRGEIRFNGFRVLKNGILRV